MNLISWQLWKKPFGDKHRGSYSLNKGIEIQSFPIGDDFIRKLRMISLLLPLGLRKVVGVLRIVVIGGIFKSLTEAQVGTWLRTTT